MQQQSSLSSSSFTVKVRAISGDTFELDLSNNGGAETLVETLKVQVAQHAQVSVERVRLIFRGKVLKDAHTIAQFGVEDGNVLHLVVRPEGQPQNQLPQASEQQAESVNQPQPLPTMDLNRLIGDLIGGPSIAQTRSLFQDTRNAFQGSNAQSVQGDDDSQSIEQVVSLLRDVSLTIGASRDSIDRLADVLEERRDSQELLRTNLQGISSLNRGLSDLTRVLRSIRHNANGEPSIDNSRPTVNVQIHAGPIFGGTVEMEVDGGDHLSGILNVVQNLVSGPASSFSGLSQSQPASSSSSNSARSSAQSSGNQNGASRVSVPVAIPASASSSSNPTDIMQMMMQGMSSSSGSSGSGANPAANIMQMMMQGMGGSGSASSPLNIGSLFQTMMQGMNAPGGGLNMGDLMRSAGPTGARGSSSGFEGLISSVMEELQLPDLLGFVSGNWSALDRIRPNLRAKFLNSILQNDSSQASLERASAEMAESMADLVASERLGSDLQSHLIPDKSLAEVSVEYLTPALRNLVALLVSTDEHPEVPNWFSTQAKNVCSDIVGGWVHHLCECFDNGQQSAYLLMNRVATSRLSSLAPEMSMLAGLGSGIISSIISKCHEAYVNKSTSVFSHLSGLNLSEFEKQQILETIESDEKRQESIETLRGHSDVYLSGQSSKKRKSSHITTENGSFRKLLQEILRELLMAEQQRTSTTIDIDAIVDNISLEMEESCREYLLGQIRERIMNDSDFEPERFPNLASLLHQSNK